MLITSGYKTSMLPVQVIFNRTFDPRGIESIDRPEPRPEGLIGRWE
ncbi:hypothetical protein ACFXOM_33125 [Streptomyces sp. NPDC059169]